MLTKHIISCIDVHDSRMVKGVSLIEFRDTGDYVELGVGEIPLTSMDAYGHQSGYGFDLTRSVSAWVPVPVIASGGAGQLNHFFGAFIRCEADAALVANIFHFSVFSIGDAKGHLAAKGVPMRCR